MIVFFLFISFILSNIYFFTFRNKQINLKIILKISIIIFASSLFIGLILLTPISNDRIRLNDTYDFLQFILGSFIFLEFLFLTHLGIHSIIKKLSTNYLSYIFPFLIISVIINTLLFLVLDSDL